MFMEKKALMWVENVLKLMFCYVKEIKLNKTL